jgi:tetratricopeptide (TPR) repeat protein
MIDYLKQVVLDLINCDERQKAWDLIDFYYANAKSIEDYDTLGYLALKADKRDTYLQCAEATYALAKTPEQLYTTRINLYKAYNAMNYPEKALYYIEQNLQITPDDFEMIAQKAFNISLAGDKETAEKMLEELQRKHPDKESKLEAAFSGKLLRQGKLSEGVRSFLETFKPESSVFDKQLNMKRWDGLIRPGTKIYIDGEGGIGDEIINIRFLDFMRNLGINPVLYSSGKYRKDTDALFRRHGYEIVNDIYSIDPRCRWAPLMSLPSYLNLTEADLWKGPYLYPKREAKNKLESSRFKIGIKCSGNPYFGQDEYRKIPLETMLKYLPIDHADIYYIDKEIGHSGTIDLGDRIDSWEDTLDFIDQMDCIVSSCTSLVHAAGAMGKTTFVAVPIAEYYIWTTSRRDTSSPWYGDNFYVMKQTRPRDWHQPLLKISEHLQQMIGLK